MFSYGVTTDRRGLLFVTDYNDECIQTFSALDGQCLGCLMKGSVAYSVYNGVQKHRHRPLLHVTFKVKNGGSTLSMFNTNVYYFERSHTKLVVCYH